jgi:hypothetical protein
MSALLQSLQKLTSLCIAEALGVAHLTFEEESILCFLLASLGQLSTWGPPTPRPWTVTHACALPKWEVLLPKLWFSILIILVQT